MLPPEITAEALAHRLQEAMPPVLLDVRETWESQTAGIAGARLMPIGEVPARVHQELDPDSPVIVFCHHGARSLNVTMWLRNQGYEQAQSLAGGIDRWSLTIDPSVPRY